MRSEETAAAGRPDRPAGLGRVTTTFEAEDFATRGAIVDKFLTDPESLAMMMAGPRRAHIDSLRTFPQLFHSAAPEWVEGP